MGVTQGLRVAAMVLAVVSLVFALIAWRASGVMRWDGLSVSVGLMLLGVAQLLGSRRRLPYYALLVASVALCALSFWIRSQR